jgi:L-ascorbate 6-phosphate lactonase
MLTVRHPILAAFLLADLLYGGEPMHPFSQLKVPQGKVGVHWFGQNSYAFRSPGGQTVLVDPYFPHERPAEKYMHAEPPMDETTLPVDAVYLTHDHSDHTHPETLARIRAAWPKCIFVGTKESAARLDKMGVPKDPFVVVEAGDMHEPDAPRDFVVYFVYSKPPAGDPERNIKAPDVTHLGLVLVCGPVRLFVTGDCVNSFAELDALVEPVRKLGPQIGFMTCHPAEGEFPFFDGCAKMVKRIGLKTAVPSHYQCFVTRNYDPEEWTKAMKDTGAAARIIGYNQATVLP